MSIFVLSFFIYCYLFTFFYKPLEKRESNYLHVFLFVWSNGPKRIRNLRALVELWYNSYSKIAKITSTYWVLTWLYRSVSFLFLKIWFWSRAGHVGFLWKFSGSGLDGFRSMDLGYLLRYLSSNFITIFIYFN